MEMTRLRMVLVHWTTIGKSHRFDSIVNQKNVLKEPRCKIMRCSLGVCQTGKIGQTYKNGDTFFFEFTFLFVIRGHTLITFAHFSPFLFRKRSNQYGLTLTYNFLIKFLYSCRVTRVPLVWIGWKSRKNPEDVSTY